MAIDATRKASQIIVENSIKALEKAQSAYNKGEMSGDALVIATMLKLLIDQLSILTVTIAEKR